MAHVTCHVMHHGHHVPGYLTPQGMAIDVQSDCGQGGSHSNAEHCHRAAFCYHIDGMDSRSLKKCYLHNNSQASKLYQKKLPRQMLRECRVCPSNQSFTWSALNLCVF
jgi:hypothetical protein